MQTVNGYWRKLGFSFLCDLENVQFNESNPEWRSFTRWMTGDAGLVLAGMQHIAPDGRARAKLLEVESHLGVVSLTSELDDGAILTSSNSRSTLKLPRPKDVVIFILRNQSPEVLLKEHRIRLAWLLEQRPTAVPRQIVTVEELLGALSRAREKTHVFFEAWSSIWRNVLNRLARGIGVR